MVWTWSPDWAPRRRPVWTPSPGHPRRRPGWTPSPAPPLPQLPRAGIHSIFIFDHTAPQHFFLLSFQKIHFCTEAIWVVGFFLLDVGAPWLSQHFDFPLYGGTTFARYTSILLFVFENVLAQNMPSGFGCSVAASNERVNGKSNKRLKEWTSKRITRWANKLLQESNGKRISRITDKRFTEWTGQRIIEWTNEIFKESNRKRVSRINGQALYWMNEQTNNRMSKRALARTKR